MVELSNAKWIEVNTFLVRIGGENQFDRLSDGILNGIRRLFFFDGAAVLLDLSSEKPEIRKSAGLEDRWIPLFARYRDCLNDKPPFQDAVMATTFEDAERPDTCEYVREFIAPLRIRAAAGFTIRDEDGNPALSFIFNKTDESFGSEDLGIMAVIQSHAENFYRLARRMECLSRLPSPESAPDFFSGILSRREREITALLSRGLRPAELARALDISVGTVRKHIEHIYDKLNVSGRRELLARVRAAGA